MNQVPQYPRQNLPNVIAVIGCDGAGKSTLTVELLNHFQDKTSVKLLYLGQSSGNIGNWIKNLPLIGSPLGRYLEAKAKRSHNEKSSPPDLATVLVIYLLSHWRAHKFRRMLSLSRRGVTVITDRFPQSEVSGFYYDGTGLGDIHTGNWLIRKLVIREKRLYEWMASHVPALIVRLNIDADTAHARKPDHKLSMLQKKITVLPKLHFNQAEILDLNSLSPYKQVVTAACHKINDMALLKTSLARVIAVVGCDGTGKSTLTADLLSMLREKGPAERRYLGLVSGEVGDKIKSLPIVGVRLEAYLASKATRAQDMKKKLPGTGTAIIMYLLSIWRVAHLKLMIRLSKKGTWVITDRYPQAEIPGFHYDGPGITASDSDNWLLRKLAAREQKLYDWMAKQRPSLVIRLNIDAKTAHSRKPDHDIVELEEKIAVMPQLNFNGAQIFEIDTINPYNEVLECAENAVNECYHNTL